MDKNTVTILIPIYGVEKYIEECAESLFLQTYKNIKYVFCNDCTPDRSIDILKEVIKRHPKRKPHIKIIQNDCNLGIGGTRANLIKEVKEGYFLFVDSDDFLPPDAVENLWNRMLETNADIVTGSYQEYSNQNYGKIWLPCHNKSDRYRNKIRIRTIPHSLCWQLYKANVLELVPNLFIKGIDVGEDYCAMSRLVEVTTRTWTDDVVYFYRTDNISSYTKQVTQKEVISFINAINIMLRFYQQRGKLPLSVEIGTLNAYCSCQEVGLSITECDNIIKYFPEHFISRLLFWLFHADKSMYPLAYFLFKFIRYIYHRCF